VDHQQLSTPSPQITSGMIKDIRLFVFSCNNYRKTVKIASLDTVYENAVYLK